MVAVAGRVRVGRPVRKAAHGGAAVSQETVAPLTVRAARGAHAVAVVYVDQKQVAPLVARAARAQRRAMQRVGGKAVLPQTPCLGWAHGVAVEATGARSRSVAAVEAVAARAAAGVLGAAVKERADCPAMEATLAPAATRSWLLPHLLS